MFGFGNLLNVTGTVFGFILLNGIFDNVISDYFWARAVVLTSPTVATIGMSITIPLAMISDYFIDAKSPTYISGIGSVLVVLGFILVNINNEHQMMFLSYLKKKINLNSFEKISESGEEE